MSRNYLYQTVGTTLFCADEYGEQRRVFSRPMQDELEVCEFTCGELTCELYGTEAHYHSIRLDEEGTRALVVRLKELADGTTGDGNPELNELLTGYFAAESRFLADLMDALDAWGVSYAYLNGVVGSHVSYRPRHASRSVAPTLRLVR